MNDTATTADFKNGMELIETKDTTNCIIAYECLKSVSINPFYVSFLIFRELNTHARTEGENTFLTVSLDYKELVEHINLDVFLNIRVQQLASFLNGKHLEIYVLSYPTYFFMVETFIYRNQH